MRVLGDFFLTQTIPSNVIQGSYDPVVVVLSFIIATIASYVSLDLLLQLRREESRPLRLFWHLSGALVFGAGIWCMHFTGMLAYHFDAQHSYDTGTTVLSLVLPFIFAFVVFHVIAVHKNTQKMGWHVIALITPFLALSILSMHYTGMAAMDIRASLHYRPDWFAVSVVVALVASLAAVLVMARFVDRVQVTRMPWQISSAVLMATAICGVHYAGMKAAVLVPYADCVIDADGAARQTYMALQVTLGALMIFMIAIITLKISENINKSLRHQVGQRTRELEVLNNELVDARDVAEAASMAKTEFLAHMSNEVRTPINTMAGLAHALRSPNMPESRRAEFTETLYETAENLLTLLDEIMDYSKIETHAVVLEQVPFRPKELIEEIASLIGFRAMERQLTLSLDYDAKSDITVLGDPFRVRQIIVNLLSNAVKFTEKGQIIVSVYTKSGDAPDKVNLVVDVQDTGAGISAEKIRHIFERFMHTKSERKYSGSGVGLAIAKGLVDRMGGTIQIASVPDKGSNFVVVLPLLRVATL